MATTNLHDEKDLLRELRGGEKQAFTSIFQTYYQVIYQFALKLSGDSEDAADIAEDVFLNLLEEKPTLNDATHLKAFLFRSVRYKWMDLRKKRIRDHAREQQYGAEQEQEETTYLAQVMRAEIILELRKAIEGLPGQAGKIISMTYLEGKSNQETADELNLSIQTVKNQKRRGLNLLKGRLSGNTYQILLLLASMAD